ncbi:MAG: DMT family transporter [Thermanaerothrix sp.]|nr:DMT family transporter [Thermanaerothrix sp.]
MTECRLNISRRTVLLADGSILLAASFWGVGFAVLKDALTYLPTFTVLACRFLIGGAILGLIFRKRLTGLSKRGISDGFIAGVLLFMAFALQTMGLIWTSAGKQAFLTATYVVLAPLISWGITKRFPGLKPMAASFICLWGIWTLGSAEAGGLNKGDLMTLGSAVFFAGHLLGVDRFSKRTDPVGLASVQMITLGLLSLPLAAMLEEPSFGAMPPRVWWSMAYMVAFSTVGAFTIQNVAQRYTSPTHAALLLSTEAVFGAIAGVLMLGEVFTPQMFIGASMVMAAILMVELQLPQGWTERLMGLFGKAEER